MPRALLALALCASPALAAEVRAFHPGGSPCLDACTLDWAAGEFGVPLGEPAPMSLPAGSVLAVMTYARAGVPLVERQTYVTVEPHDGIGYALADGRLMFRVADCGNWTIAIPAGGVADETLAAAPAGGSGGSPRAGGSPGSPSFPITPLFPVAPNSPGPGPVPPEPTSPVPLPATALLLLAAIGLLRLTLTEKEAAK